MTRSCRTRPPPGGCAALTRLGRRCRIWHRRGCGGQDGRRLAPLAVGPRGVPPAPRQDAGRGKGWRGFAGAMGRAKRAAGSWRYDKILPHPPTPGRVRCAYPPGRARQDWHRRGGGEGDALRLRSGRRPARGATGTPASCGPGNRSGARVRRWRGCVGCGFNRTPGLRAGPPAAARVSTMRAGFARAAGLGCCAGQRGGAKRGKHLSGGNHADPRRCLGRECP